MAWSIQLFYLNRDLTLLAAGGAGDIPY